jgi:PAS domain-containing protein
MVQRWILEQNLGRFRSFLAAETNERSRLTLRGMIAQAERELAILHAAEAGAGGGPGLALSAESSFSRDCCQISRFREDFAESPQAYLLLDPGPGLHIIEANAAYAAATMIDPAAVVGQRLFNVFPDNPDEPLADGMSQLLRSLQIAAGTGLRHRMKVQRYDIRDAEGVFVERHWRLRNIPLVDEYGQLRCLVHHVEDVTAAVRAEMAQDMAHL